MSEESDAATLSIQIANQFINVANNLMSEGMPPLAIAAGLRHAGANFTAFAIVHGQEETPPDQVFHEEFSQLFAYYTERHGESVNAPLGLKDLIEKAKGEF